MDGVILSVLMLAGIALAIGAAALWRRGVRGQRIWLMLTAAAVMFANVAVWVVPVG